MKNGIPSFTLISIRIISHYETALYCFLSPILGNAFFPHHSSLMQLIFIYSVMASGIIFRPVGTYLFHQISLQISIENTAKISIGGVFLFMFLFACAPNGSSIGIWGIAFLVFSRIGLDVSVAGTQSLGEILTLPKSACGAFSFWENLSSGVSIVGPLLALIVASKVVDVSESSSEAWRIPFLLGAALCVSAVLLSQDSFSSAVFRPLTNKPLLQYIGRYWRTVCMSVFCSAFYYLTYAVPLFFINCYVPLVSSIRFADLIKISILLLIFDMFLPFVCKPIFRRFSLQKLMVLSAIIVSLTGSPLLLFLTNSSLIYIFFVQFWFVFWGSIFGMCWMAWFSKNFPDPFHHFILGIGHTVGHCFFGRMTPFFVLSSIQWTGSLWSASLYVALIGFMTIRFILLQKKY